MPLVLEGLVSTLDAEGRPHLAPMGPHVPSEEFDRFTLRPFPSSQTYRNLRAHGEGVLHVTDDVLLMAKAAIGPDEPPPAGHDRGQDRRSGGTCGDGAVASASGRARSVSDRRTFGMTRVTTGSRLH